MEIIGGVASILTAAEAGAKASLSIFRFVDAWKSAPKEIRAIGTDIALLSPVIEDLWHVLERVKVHNDIIPAVGVDNARRIAVECINLFKDIEDTLNPTEENRKDGGEDTNHTKRSRWSLIRSTSSRLMGLRAREEAAKGFDADRLKWILTKKDKVAIWQGQLASLKTSITMQLGVINLQEKLHRGLSINDLSSADMRSLEALLEARKSTRVDLKDLIGSENKEVFSPAEHSEAPSSSNIRGLDGEEQRNPSRSETTHATESSHVNTTFTVIPNPVDMQRRNWSKPNSSIAAASAPIGQDAARQNDSPSIAQIPITIRKPSERYIEVWTTLDILEHAIRKVELAQWELERIQRNSKRMNKLHEGGQVVSTGCEQWPEDEDMLKSEAKLTETLTEKLGGLGLSERSSYRIVKHLFRRCHHKYSGLRQLIDLGPQCDELNLSTRCMHNGKGVSLRSVLLSQDEMLTRKTLDPLFPDTSRWSHETSRWVPDELDDILFHTVYTQTLLSPHEIFRPTKFLRSSSSRLYEEDYEISPTRATPPSRAKRRSRFGGLPPERSSSPINELSAANDTIYLSDDSIARSWWSKGMLKRKHRTRVIRNFDPIYEPIHKPSTAAAPVMRSSFRAHDRRQETKLSDDTSPTEKPTEGIDWAEGRAAELLEAYRRKG